MSSVKVNILEKARPSVISLKPYASAKEEFKGMAKELVYLDANENPYENGLNRYPDPNQSLLKNRISIIKNVPAHQIILGNGSDEVLDMIFRVFVEPGKDNIIINTPTFGMFEVLSNINNVECRKVQLTTEFDLDPEAIIKQIDVHTKAIFICSPNNPTGNIMSEEAILSLLRLEVLVVIDEAYIDFADTESWTKRLHEFNNLIVTQTFSKAFGLAGIRLGACYADQQVIDLLKKVKMPYNVNVLTQTKAAEYLQNEEARKTEVNRIIRNRSILKNELQTLDMVKKIYKSDSNFLLVRFDDANKRYDQLIHKDIVVRNRTREPLCENCLRITVGTTAENLKLIQTLRGLDKTTLKS
jgi:histidinol-phosphate aminotransferase